MAIMTESAAKMDPRMAALEAKLRAQQGLAPDVERPAPLFVQANVLTEMLWQASERLIHVERLLKGEWDEAGPETFNTTRLAGSLDASHMFAARILRTLDLIEKHL